MPALNHYRLLGRSGLRVSPMALGTMTFGTAWGWGADEAEASRILDLYLEGGGNLVDTSVNYTDGESERLLGRLLEGRRERVVLATKYTMARQPGNPNAGGNHRLNLVRSVETSLRQLATDRIDLLYLHGWDFTTGPDEVMRALDDLVRAGKVLYLGICNTPAWRVAQLQTLAELCRWTPLVALQVEYSLVERSVEHELLPMAQALGLGVLPWSPLGGGVLAGRYGRADAGESAAAGVTGSRRDVLAAMGLLSEQTLAVAEAVRAVAAEAGVPPAQVALAWLLTRRGVVAPVIGARTAAQLQQNLAALDLQLAPEQLQRLDAVSAPAPIFPAVFMARPMAQQLLYGGATVERRDGGWVAA